MHTYTRESCLKEAIIFKALGHPIRLWMVQQVLASKTDYCVADFVEAIGTKYATISQHLKILREAGIFLDDKRGKAVYYIFASPEMESFIRNVMKLSSVQPPALAL